MNERSKLINKLKNNSNTRISYIRSKVNINLCSQIRALRKIFFSNQEGLAKEANMLQSRISTMEQPGAVKFNIETLIRLAAAFKVGLLVKFVPYSDVLKWDNEFSQDKFNVTPIDTDVDFLEPSDETIEGSGFAQKFWPASPSNSYPTGENIPVAIALSATEHIKDSNQYTIGSKRILAIPGGD